MCKDIDVVPQVGSLHRFSKPVAYFPSAAQSMTQGIEVFIASDASQEARKAWIDAAVIWIKISLVVERLASTTALQYPPSTTIESSRIGDHGRGNRHPALLTRLKTGTKRAIIDRASLRIEKRATVTSAAHSLDRCLPATAAFVATRNSSRSCELQSGTH